MTAEQHISEHMANLSVQDSEHLEELIECARYGELEEIQAVVQTSGPEKAKVLLSHKAVNIQNDQGNTALHWAATNGHAKVVETLITKGKADYKLKNASGHTAMLEAEMSEREQVVAWMLINTELEEDVKEGNDDDEDEDESSSDEEEEEDKKIEGSSTKA
ncbi:hypothetical protein BKA57DRAFT_281643 [Linnemannia elongata]|nr:hypothetical protein BKA57DRAFT_281643 [Linnemannia elongata]